MAPRIIYEAKPASIMDPGGRTEEFSILRAEAEEFEVNQLIRRHAAESLAKLEIIVRLMEYSRATPAGPNIVLAA
jgi:hypothetical protein